MKYFRPVGLADLRRETAGHYRAPKAILLNRRYIDYLRRLRVRVVLRFRASNPEAPVVLFDGNRAIGALMPLEE